jgi:hypothetical protein
LKSDKEGECVFEDTTGNVHILGEKRVLQANAVFSRGYALGGEDCVLLPQTFPTSDLAPQMPVNV